MNLLSSNKRAMIIGATCATAGSLVFLYKTYKIYMMRKKYSHIPGPPSPGLFGFYLGNLDTVVEGMKDGKILADLVHEWIETYGSVIKFQILDKTVVFTVDPIAIRDLLILENHPKIKQVYENVGFPYNERYLGRGLITEVENSGWKSKRSLMNPAFHKKPLMSYISHFNEKGDILIEKLRGLADGKTLVTLFTEINHAALDIIASVAFDLQVDSINDPQNKLNHYVYESVKGFYRITFDPFIYYKPSEWSYIKNYKSIIRKLRDIGREQILNKIKQISEDKFFSADILAGLIKRSQKINIEDLVDGFLTFFVAGQETTANTLAFTFLELGRNERVMKKLREELDDVLGSRTEVRFEDLHKLNYTLCVYKEVLRLWPPIPEIGREIRSDMNINGYEIPEGTWVQISTYVSGRNKDFFQNPFEFYPERFLVDSSGENNIKNYTYFPFSLGPRHCLGQNFAQMASKVLIAKVVKNFDIILEPSQNFGLKQEATLRPADGTKCYLMPRKN